MVTFDDEISKNCQSGSAPNLTEFGENTNSTLPVITITKPKTTDDIIEMADDVIFDDAKKLVLIFRENNTSKKCKLVFNFS